MKKNRIGLERRAYLSIPQMANPYGDLTGWQNLMLMADLYGVLAQVARKRAMELVKDVGLRSFPPFALRTLADQFLAACGLEDPLEGLPSLAVLGQA